MDKIDINLSAQFYIQQYGVEASVQAAMKADTMLERGDIDGFNAWMRIPFPAVHGRLRCQACGSRDIHARPGRYGSAALRRVAEIAFMAN